MLTFTQLLDSLKSSKNSDHSRLILDYLQNSNWDTIQTAVNLLLNITPAKAVSGNSLKKFTLQKTGYAEWLFDESYKVSGNLLETISLITGEPEAIIPTTLPEFIYTDFPVISREVKKGKTSALFNFWETHGIAERLLLNALLCGRFSPPVSRGRVILALSGFLGIAPEQLALHIYSRPDTEEILINQNFSELFVNPIPDQFAHFSEREEITSAPALNKDEICFSLEVPHGIRCRIYVWEAGIFAITPELELLVLPSALIAEAQKFPEGTVLEGILQHHESGTKDSDKFFIYNAIDVFRPECGFPELYSGYKSGRILSEDYYVLPIPGTRSRNKIPENQCAGQIFTIVTPGENSAPRILFLKRQANQIEAMLLYAEIEGNLNRDSFKSYTFGIEKDDVYIPIVKISAPIEGAFVQEIDSYIQNNITEKFGPVRSVKPGLTATIRYDGTQPSPRTKAGYKLINAKVVGVGTH